jgi:Flp pilus assembly protein TadG
MNYSLTPLRLMTQRRDAATAVECAFVLPVMLLVLFAMLDLSIAVVRYNALAEASRRIARAATIRGSLAPAVTGSVGPAEFDGSASVDSELVAPARDFLTTMDPALVAVKVSWPDGENSPRRRVRVEMAFQHVPLIPALFAWGPIDLHANTTMRIVN